MSIQETIKKNKEDFDIEAIRNICPLVAGECFYALCRFYSSKVERGCVIFAYLVKELEYNGK